MRGRLFVCSFVYAHDVSGILYKSLFSEAKESMASEAIVYNRLNIGLG
jgi:hypothetical protein